VTEPMTEQQWKRQAIDGAYLMMTSSEAMYVSHPLYQLWSESPLVKGDGPPSRGSTMTSSAWATTAGEGSSVTEVVEDEG
jgi:hypothetical protein